VASLSSLLDRRAKLNPHIANLLAATQIVKKRASAEQTNQTVSFDMTGNPNDQIAIVSILNPIPMTWETQDVFDIMAQQFKERLESSAIHTRSHLQDYVSKTAR
jgi:hypothetical protein